MEKSNAVRRLVIVSNRLPFTVAVEDGVLKYRESSGGLATGLSSFLPSLGSESSLADAYLWIGWPGENVDGSLREQLIHDARANNSHPVFLTQEEMDQFYFGFCNKTIWPLFHYFPSHAAYQEKMWQQYVHVNEIFCNSVLETVDEKDIVWIHDYHLMLLPRMLKLKLPRLRVGFFLHIPFPSFEVFRLFPGRWRREILEGLLGADLVGFHTYEYAQHFLQCTLRILGLEHTMGQILTPEGIVKAGTFPMGIDYQKFSHAASSDKVEEERKSLRTTLGDAKVILSVDRLDYSKGILGRLLAFEFFLEANPDFRGKVVLVMVVVPSRVGVDQYDLMKKQIEELVGKINGKFGQIGWTPVVYQFRHVPFESLVALYGISDVALVTPLRDGMNLVAKEYLASRADGSGVLILSEMAGAAKELGETIIINPNSPEEIAEAVKQALETPLDEQKRRNHIMQSRLQRYTVNRWAADFVRDLGEMGELQLKLSAKLLSTTMKTRLAEAYSSSRRRLLLLDYDGTLVGFKRIPQEAKPTAEVMRLLAQFSEDECNLVVLISGRDQRTLEEWFGNVRMSLVAEHGMWIRSNTGEWKAMMEPTSDWKPRILPTLQLYADRLPGAFVEQKDYSLVFHFRGADPEHGEMLARELTDYLVSFTANINVQVLRGHKVVEVRPAGVNKGTAAAYFLSHGAFDFVLAVGDDWTDEDMFMALLESAYSIKVGIASSRARFNVKSPRDVLKILELLVRKHSLSEGLDSDKLVHLPQHILPLT